MALPAPLPEAEKAPEKELVLGFEGGGGRGGDEEGGDGGGDGGGGGGGGGDGEPPRRDDFPIGRAKLAMVFVLASLSVLFVVTLFVALLLRRSAAHWNPGVA